MKKTIEEIRNDIVDQTAYLFKDRPNDDAIHGIALALMWMDDLDYVPLSMWVMLIQTKIKELNKL